MLASLTTVAILLLSCRDRLPTTPEWPEPRPDAALTEPVPGCLRLELTLTGKDSVAVGVADAGCGDVRPAVAGTPTYDRSSRALHIPLAIENAGAAPIEAPALLFSWEDSLSVLSPPGLAQNKHTGDYLAFENADSVRSAGAAELPGATVWRMDSQLAAAEGSLLTPGGRSASRDIAISVKQGVKAVSVVLYAQAAPASVASADTITLTYLCGNTFQVRSNSAAPLLLTWNTVPAPAGGSGPGMDTLRVPPRPRTAPYVETFFSTGEAATVRLFRAGKQIQQAANGGRSCASQPIPPAPSGVDFPDDTVAFPVTASRVGRLLYRGIVGVVFTADVTPAQFWSFMGKYHATIIGGEPFIDLYYLSVTNAGASMDSLDAMWARMKAEPGVDLVMNPSFRDFAGVNARFPDDGLIHRADWYGNPTEDSWAWRSIRAPLAWGCENGRYGPAKVRIGVTDWFFDDGNPDFPSSAHRYDPSTGLLPIISAVRTPSDTLDDRLHGTMMVGAISAPGDNGMGIAGMLWDSDMYMFAFGRGDSVPKFNIQRMIEVLRIARDQRVRVLANSMNVYYQRPDEVEGLRRALATYLDGDNLFVVAAGNTFIPVPLDYITLEAMKNSQKADTVGGAMADRIAAAELIKISGYRDRVFIVAGTEAGWLGKPTSWPFSMYFSGGLTEIAAPAEHIPTLVPRSHQARFGAVRVEDGTSIATAIVAGLAGQLWAMDPLLHAEDVHRYIVEGARAPRFDTLTNTVHAPDSIKFSGEYVHQIDAYSSLSLLSATRPHTPVCGIPVLPAGPEDSYVYIGRRSPEKLPVQGPRGYGYMLSASGFSVAQGGRVISLTRGDGAGIDLVDYRGASLGHVDGVADRLYLEKDTADLLADDARTIRIHGSVDRQVSLWPLLQSVLDRDPWSYGLPTASVSPDGRWVGVLLNYYNAGCGIYGYARTVGLWVLPTDGASPRRIRTLSDECPVDGPLGVTNGGDDFLDDQSAGVAWTHDSRRVLFSYGTINSQFTPVPVTTRFFVYEPQAQATVTATLPGVDLWGLRFTGDDAQIYALPTNWDALGCATEKLFAAAPPFAALGTVTWGGCEYAHLILPNRVQPGITAGRAHPRPGPSSGH